MYVERSQRALQRVKQLVDGLLRFARSGARTDGDGHSSVDAVLKSLALDYAEAAKSASIEIVVEPSERIDAACSAAVLTSIVQNLVSNAIKYIGTSAVRRITLAASADGTRVSVMVGDSGPGMSDDVRAHMFEPFVRGDHAEITGIGLGLATVKRLVEAHAGSVEVESTIGLGTRIRVQLPLAATSRVSASTAAAAAPRRDQGDPIS